MAKVYQKNPYLTHKIDKFCSICLNVFDSESNYKMDASIFANENVSVADVLKSISVFFPLSNEQSVCTSCFLKADIAYKFHIMCNEAQMYQDIYLQQEMALSKDVKHEVIDIEENEIQIEPSSISDNINGNNQDINEVKEDIYEIEEVEEVEIDDSDQDNYQPVDDRVTDKIECKICHAYITTGRIKKHMQLHSKAKEKNNGAERRACEFCDKRIRSDCMRKHLVLHRNLKSSVFPKVINGQVLNTNGVGVDGQPVRSPKKSKNCKCQICHVVIRYSSMKRHMTKVHGLNCNAS